MRELYPMIRIKLFYGRDFRALLLKYGRLADAPALIGIEGQVAPRAAAGAVPQAASPEPSVAPATEAEPVLASVAAGASAA
jgi:hypothetical protein